MSEHTEAEIVDLVPVPRQANPKELMRMSSDVAGATREIVKSTAVNIQGKHYVKVEGWQAIAIAHGCVASARDVEVTETGVKAIGEIRRMSDGALISQAEGFVGNDEGMWKKRPEYAKRAMAQTRAISRAARSAFAHVVVMIDANLSTTPAEEVPREGFGDRPKRSKKADQELVDNLAIAIMDCEEIDDLNAIAQEIKDMPSGARDDLRSIWLARKAELAAEVLNG